jgi:hypothetical protein
MSFFFSHEFMIIKIYELFLYIKNKKIKIIKEKTILRKLQKREGLSNNWVRGLWPKMAHK